MPGNVRMGGDSRSLSACVRCGFSSCNGSSCSDACAWPYTRHAIVSSPAVRTATTAALFASAIGLSADRVSINAELYFAGAPMLLRAASLFDDTCAAVMLVGHNPAVTDFVNELVGLNSGIAIDTVPTSGLLQFELGIESWAHIALGDARLIEFDYPKKESK